MSWWNSNKDTEDKPNVVEEQLKAHDELVRDLEELTTEERQELADELPVVDEQK